jgi:hypothetical protein
MLPHLHVISCTVTQQNQRATRVTLARICSSKGANRKDNGSTAAIHQAV